MEQFLKLVRAQQEMAQELLDGYRPFKAAMEQFRNELNRAPEAYRQAGLYYRERADKETDRLFKENYGRLADSCEIYAATVHKRHKEIDRFLQEVE